MKFDVCTEWDKLVKNIKKNNSAKRLRKIKIIGDMTEKEHRRLNKYE